MKIKKFKFNISKLMIVAVCILLLTGVVFYYEELKDDSYEIETVKVVVLSRNIKENTILTQNYVHIEERYKEDVLKQNNIICNLDDAIGKRTKVPLYRNEILNSNRVIKNESWMDSKDKTQISIEICDVDKAHLIKKGDYIDIWMEPKQNTISTKEDTSLKKSKKILEKLEIVEVCSSEFNKNSDNKEFVTSYIIIQLNNSDIEKFLNININKYSIRICKYGEQSFYDVLATVK